MKKLTKIMAILMSITMLTSVVGCNKKKEINYEDDMSKHVTLTFWTPVQSWAKGGIDTLADSDVYKEIEKKFNVTIKFTHPVAGQEQTQFNLMIAKDELPDIISPARWYQGGIQKGIDEGAFIDLTNLVEKYAPDYRLRPCRPAHRSRPRPCRASTSSAAPPPAYESSRHRSAA